MVFKYSLTALPEPVLAVAKKKLDHSLEDKVVVNGHMCELKEENVNTYRNVFFRLTSIFNMF